MRAWRNAQIGVGAGFGSTTDAAWTPAAWGNDRLADYTADDVLLSGSNITAFVDQLGATNMVQANAAFQAEIVASYAGLGGKYAALFTTDFYLANLTYAATSWSAAYVLDNVATADEDLMIYDTETGRSIVLIRKSGSDNAHVYDGAFYSMGGGHVDTASHISVFAGTTYTLYGSGSQIGTRSISAVQIGGGSGLGSNYVGSGGYLTNCYLSRFTLLKRAATSDDRDNWFAWTLAEYGV